MDLFNSLPPDLLNTNREPNVFELAAARDLLFRIELDLFALYEQIETVNVCLKELESNRRGLFNFNPPDLLPDAFEHSAAQMLLPSVEFGVDRQIVETEAHLNDLESQKDALEQMENMVINVISPIRRVPHDILCHIFKYCETSYPTSLSPKVAPLLLTHVCSAFRKIALRMPMLWTNVWFKIGRMEMSDSSSGRGKEASTNQMLRSLAAQCSGMEKYLLRSGSLPLDLDIDYKDFPKDTDKETRDLYLEMNKVVLSHHARWRDFRVRYHDPLPEETLAQLRSFTPDDLPLIRTLRLEVMLGYDNISKIEFIPILACPTLKTVSGFRLDGLHHHADVLRTSFANLTTVIGTTYECSIPDMVKTLQMCPSLVNLRLCQLYKPDYGNINIDNNFLISFPYLENLRVSDPFSSNNGDSIVNKYLSAPKLKRVEYEGGFMYPSLVSFFKRSISLTALEMDVEISAELFIEALRSCPQLRAIDELPILMSEDTGELLAYDRLFTRLVDADNAGDVVCPNLEVLIREHNQISFLLFDTLQALIVRKITPSPGLAAWNFIYIPEAFVSRQNMAPVEELLSKYSKEQIWIEIKGCYDDM